MMFFFDDSVSGVFTMNVVAAAPVVYCKKVLETSNTVNPLPPCLN